MSDVQERQGILADLKQADPVLRGQAVDRLAALGDPKLAGRLQPLLEDGDPVVAFKAALGLASLGDHLGLDRLLRALRQADLRSFALDALIDLGAKEAIPQLQKFMGRLFLHPLEKMQAAAALCRAGDESGRSYLQARLESRRPEERGFALELWGRLALPEAFELLSAVLADTGHSHRMDAMRGLVHLGDPRAKDLLERVATEEEGDDDLAAEARWALQAFEESSS